MKKKYLSILTANIAIYLFSILRTLIFISLPDSIFVSSMVDVIVLVSNCISDIVAIVFVIFTLYKNVDFKFYDFFIIIINNYILFSIYETPTWYMFVYTGKSGGIFSDFRDALPSYVASFRITIQYAIVILITLLILKQKDKDKED